MQKIFYILFGAVLLLSSCKKQENIDIKEKQFKAEFYASCIASIKKSGGDLFNQELAASYCSCVIETVLPHLSETEIAQISENNNLAVQTKINELVEPCLQDYLNKIESLE